MLSLILYTVIAMYINFIFFLTTIIAFVLERAESSCWRHYKYIFQWNASRHTVQTQKTWMHFSKTTGCIHIQMFDIQLCCSIHGFRKRLLDGISFSLRVKYSGNKKYSPSSDSSCFIVLQHNNRVDLMWFFQLKKSLFNVKVKTDPYTVLCLCLERVLVSQYCDKSCCPDVQNIH